MELLRLLLLDDEHIILEGMKKTYQWEEMGYEVVGAYTDAEDAMAELAGTKPQVILSDIRMRNMDGLEFFRQVCEEIPDCLGIFVSAYRDFDYAKRACELGAFGYLPKPFKEEDLRDFMLRAHDEYLKKKEALRGRLIAEYLSSKQNAAFINTMVEKFAKNQADAEGMERLFDITAGLSPKNMVFSCAVIDVDVEYSLNNEMEYEATRFELFEQLDETLKKYYRVWSFLLDNGSKAFIVDLSENKECAAVQELIAEVSRKKGVEVISVVSKEYSGIFGIQESYKQARQLYEIMLGYGSGMAPIKSEELIADRRSINSKELEIIDVIRRNDANAIKDCYREFINEISSQNEDVMMYLLQLAIRAQIYVRETYGETERLNGAYQSFFRGIFSVSVSGGEDILYNLLVQTIKSRLEYCRENSANNFTSYIRQAMDYVEAHYAEESLTVNDVAAAIYLNPVYFGRMFKQNTGIPFRRHLMNVRMEKAKQLLLQGEHGVLQIGEMVGIENPSYFTQLFKQYTGMVPSEFAGGKS